LIIAYDTWALRPSHRNSGIYNYAKYLLRELQNLEGVCNEVSIRPFFSKGYSDEAALTGASDCIQPVETSLLRYHRLWQLGGVTAAATQARADLIFSPSTHTCPFGPIPVITTLHDATPDVSPCLAGWPNLLEKIRLRNAARFSAQCITVSECSKRDIVKFYGAPPEKVTVVYLGYDRAVFNASGVDRAKQAALLQRWGIAGPYIFHHGTLQPRKNLERLIRACQMLWKTPGGEPFQLVLAGPLGWRYHPILEAAGRSGVPARVVLTGALPDEDLALLLKGAELCVIPSLYEGFCLPMVEAMACGVPTVAAHGSCLPEVSGGVLKYFDPLSVEDMAETIRCARTDTGLRERLRRNGMARAQEFSWERCAMETLGILRRTVGDDDRKLAPVPLSSVLHGNS